MKPNNGPDSHQERATPGSLAVLSKSNDLDPMPFGKKSGYKKTVVKKTAKKKGK